MVNITIRTVGYIRAQLVMWSIDLFQLLVWAFVRTGCGRRHMCVLVRVRACVQCCVGLYVYVRACVCACSRARMCVYVCVGTCACERVHAHVG